MIPGLRNKWARQGLLLAATAMPGIQSLLTLWLISNWWGLTVLGRVAGDIGVVTLLGFFSAVGWSAFLLIRLPRLRPTRKAQLVVMVGLRVLFVSVAGSIVLWTLSLFGFVAHWMAASLYLCGWSGYQVLRHYALANKRYGHLLGCDLSSLAVAAMSIALASEEAYLLAGLGVGSFAFATLFMLRNVLSIRAAGLSAWRPARKLWSTSMGSAVSNAMSGGVGALLPPLVRVVSGEVFAGVLAIILSVVRMLLLFPRALSFQQLIPLTTAAGQKNWNLVAHRLAESRRYIAVVLFGLTLPVAVAWLLGGYRIFGIASDTPYLHVGFLINLATFCLSQLVIPEANLVMVLERVQEQMTINAKALAVFAIGIALACASELPPALMFVTFLLAQLFATAARSWWTAAASRRIFAHLE